MSIPRWSRRPFRGSTDWTDVEVWQLGVGFLERGMPFHAHEVFEQRWRTCPAGERTAWRAAAQWGAAETHAARGNAVGAARLAARAMETLDSAGSVPEGIDTELLTGACAALASGSDPSGNGTP